MNVAALAPIFVVYEPEPFGKLESDGIKLRMSVGELAKVLQSLVDGLQRLISTVRTPVNVKLL